MSDLQDPVAELARRFQFLADYDLAQELEQVAAQYDHHNKLYFSSPGERRNAARASEEHLRRFLESLPHLDRAGGRYYVPDDTRRELEKIQSTLGAAAEALAGKRGGGPEPNVAKNVLVTDLCQIYRCGTRRNCGYTQIPGTNDYTGEFIDFAQAAASLLKVPLTRDFIGRRLKEINSELASADLT